MKYKAIGQNIRYHRNKLSLTQQELADKVGVTWEMISRYERGNSSPMDRLDEIAGALELRPADLMVEPGAAGAGTGGGNGQKVNEVPLFIKVPEDGKFVAEATQFYYTAATWMVKKDKDVFAVDSGIVAIKTMRVKEDGVIFVAPKVKPVASSIVLVRGEQKLVVEAYSNLSASEKLNVVGVLIAQEMRF